MTIPLIPGGQNISVTNDNREEYVKAYMDHYLHEHIRQEFDAFQRGFEKICGGQALKVTRNESVGVYTDISIHFVLQRDPWLLTLASPFPFFLTLQ
jgi:hypothetical protein